MKLEEMSNSLVLKEGQEQGYKLRGGNQGIRMDVEFSKYLIENNINTSYGLTGELLCQQGVRYAVPRNIVRKKEGEGKGTYPEIYLNFDEKREVRKVYTLAEERW